MVRHLLRAAAVLALPLALHAQAPAAQPAAPPPPANPADVASEDAIVKAVYDVISGPAGPRDWDRFRSLFAPGARLIPTGPKQGGGFGHRVWTPDEYAQRAADWFSKEPFYEVEQAHRSERFGTVVHRFSTYLSKKAPGEQPFARGINSIQLFNDGTRWWVLTIMWDQERPGLTIPDEYLTSGR